MKFLFAIVCLVCFTLPSISYTQISVNDLIEDVKKERGDATDTGKEASDASAMEGMMEGLIESGNIVSDEPLEVRCLTVLHSHHMKLLVSQGMVKESKGNCKRAKEGLEFQAMLILSGGTQFYCTDEYNSDKVAYAILILEYMFEDYLRGKHPTESLTEIFDRLEELSEDLGNPYGKAALLFGRIKENYDRAGIQHYTAGIDAFLQKEVYQLNDAKWQEHRSKVYEELIDYITYFHSPEFMTDRSVRINSLIESLPCD